MGTIDKANHPANDFLAGRVREYGLRTVKAIDGVHQLQRFYRDKSGFYVVQRSFQRAGTWKESEITDMLVALGNHVLGTLEVTPGGLLTLSAE